MFTGILKDKKWNSQTSKFWKISTRKFWKWNSKTFGSELFFANVYFDKVGIDFEFWHSRKTVLIGLDSYLDLKNHKFSFFFSIFCIPLCSDDLPLYWWSFTYPALCLTCLLRTPLSVQIEHVELINWSKFDTKNKILVSKFSSQNFRLKNVGLKKFVKSLSKSHHEISRHNWLKNFEEKIWIKN